MKTTIIALLLLPTLAFSQTRKIKVDHHLKARKAAYTSMALAGISMVTFAGIVSADEDMITQAAGMAGAIGVASLAYQIKAWHHIGEAGNKRTASIGVGMDGLTLALNF